MSLELPTTDPVSLFYLDMTVGNVIFMDTGVYEGEFKMGLKDGQGKWEAPGHQVYVGEYKADKRHGLGVCVVCAVCAHAQVYDQWMPNAVMSWRLNGGVSIVSCKHCETNVCPALRMHAPTPRSSTLRYPGTLIGFT